MSMCTNTIANEDNYLMFPAESAPISTHAVNQNKRLLPGEKVFYQYLWGHLIFFSLRSTGVTLTNFYFKKMYTTDLQLV